MFNIMTENQGQKLISKRSNWERWQETLNPIFNFFLHFSRCACELLDPFLLNIHFIKTTRVTP